MKIKTGDQVIITTGKDKGKKGKVLEAFPKDNRVLVEGMNVVKKHKKSRMKMGTGKLIEKSMPIHVSNVAIVDPKSGKPTRVKIERTGLVRNRIAVKSGATL